MYINTKTEGYSCVYFNGTNVKNVEFRNLYPNGNIPTVFAGHGSGEVLCDGLRADGLQLSKTEGICVRNVTQE